MKKMSQKYFKQKSKALEKNAIFILFDERMTLNWFYFLLVKGRGRQSRIPDFEYESRIPFSIPEIWDCLPTPG